MTFLMKELSSPTNVDWNGIISNLPDAHILQSGQWADLKRDNQWIPRYLVWEDQKGKIIAAVCIHQKKVPIINRFSRATLLYAPRGPIMDWSNLDTVDQVIDDLEQFARAQGAFFLKIDPDLPIGPVEDAKPLPSGVIATNNLSSRKWLFSQDQLQFRNTILIDLTESTDYLLQRMKQKTRYNIRLAERKGVYIRVGKEIDLPGLFQMYAHTSSRDGFVIRTREYYLKVWGQLMREGMATPLLAEAEGEPVAAIILFHFAKRAYYFYGMSMDRHREWMPNHLLQWYAIQHAKTIGCEVYDFWGAPDQLDESDPMYGVYRFKEGFSGKMVYGLGAWDFPARPAWYRFYTRFLPPVLGLMRIFARRRVKKEASL